MPEYYCQEHGVKFFKTPKMKGYAHPVKDENGEQEEDENGKPVWCNMPKAPETESESAIMKEIHKTAKPTSDDMSKKDWADKDRVTRESIETQTAYNGIMLVVSGHGIPTVQGVPDPNTKIAKAYDIALDWALTRFPTTAGTAPQMDVKVTVAEDVKEVSDTPNFKNKGDFYQLCYTKYGLNKGLVDKEIAGMPLTTIKELNEAFAHIEVVYNVKEDLPFE